MNRMERTCDFSALSLGLRCRSVVHPRLCLGVRCFAAIDTPNRCDTAAFGLTRPRTDLDRGRRHHRRLHLLNRDQGEVMRTRPSKLATGLVAVTAVRAR
jgi:hypothetical protein